VSGTGRTDSPSARATDPEPGVSDRASEGEPRSEAVCHPGYAGAMAIEIVGLDHVVLRVRDVARSIAFYCDVLGCKEERRLDALGLIQLRAGRHLIDLVDVSGPLGRAGGEAAGDLGRNVDHFALQVRDFDESALRRHLEAKGVEPGEVRTLYGAEGSGPAMYVRDPDGNTVELKGV